MSFYLNRDTSFVMICDWHGRLVWSSETEILSHVGEHAWSLFAETDVEKAREALARTATLREIQSVEVCDQQGQILRMRLWPLDPPDAAICILCFRLPRELCKLTAREKDCLVLLGQGMSAKLVARELDIGISTVHTYLKRIRVKLDLPRVEALISFAARFCHLGNNPPLSSEPG